MFAVNAIYFLIKVYIERQQLLSFTHLHKIGKIFKNKKKLKFFTILVLLPLKCNELAELIAKTSAKAHSARLHRLRVDDNCVYLIDSGNESSFPRQRARASTTRSYGWSLKRKTLSIFDFVTAKSCSALELGLCHVSLGCFCFCHIALYLDLLRAMFLNNLIKPSLKI